MNIEEMTDSIVTDPVDIDSGMYNEYHTICYLNDQKLQTGKLSENASSKLLHMRADWIEGSCVWHFYRSILLL